MQTAAQPAVTVSLASLRADLRLSRERMARLFDVSAKTIERWEERGSLPPAIADRRTMMQIHEIRDLGRVVYGDKGLHAFLATPLPIFNGATALQMIERGEGDAVLAALATDYEGLGP